MFAADGGQRAGQGVHPAEHGVPVQHLEGRGRLAGRTVSPSSASAVEDERSGAAGLPGEERRRRRSPTAPRTSSSQRLTDLNAALTKAKTERINKEALYNQLKSAEGTGALDTLPDGPGERLHPEAQDRARRSAAPAGAARRALRRAARGDDQDPHRRSRRADAKLRNEISQGRRVGQERVSGRAQRGTEPADRARRAEGRSAQPEPQGHRVRRPAARGGEQPADLREPAAAHQGNRHLERARDRRTSASSTRRRCRARRSRRTSSAMSWSSFGGSLLLRRRPGVPRRVPRQPDQDAAGIEGAPRRAVPRHGAGGQGQGRSESAARATTWPPISPKRSRRSAPTCCSRRPTRACASLVVTSAGPGEGKSVVSAQPRDRARAGRPARAADRRRHAAAARARDLRRRSGARPVERADRQRQGQRRHPPLADCTACGCSAPVTFRRTRRSCSARGASLDFIASLDEHFDWVDHRHAAGARRHRQLDRRERGVRRGLRRGRRQDQPARRARRGRTARCGERAHRRLGAEPGGPGAQSVLLLVATTARNTRSTT